MHVNVERARHALRRPAPEIGVADDILAARADPPTTTVFVNPPGTTTNSIINLTPITATPAPEDATLTTTAPHFTPITATPAPEDASISAQPSSASSNSSSNPPSNPPSNAPSNATPMAIKSNKLSSGLVAGIAVASVVAIFVLFFLLRRMVVGARNKKTSKWGGKMIPKIKQTSVEKSAVGYPFAFRHETANAFSSVLPPPLAYNSDPSPNPPSVSATLGHSTNVATGRTATVCCTFIPTLPDELSISNGEIVRIVNEFDDGWSLCVNSRGEQGMVPLECLQKGTSGALITDSPSVTEWRNAQRASSLAPPGSSRY
jgi:hypothetical protein